MEIPSNEKMATGKGVSPPIEWLRFLFNFLSLLSLLVLIAVLVLWYRGYRTADYFAYCGQTKELGLISTVGRIVVYHETAIPPFRWNGSFGFQYAALPAPDSISAYTLANSPRPVEWFGF